jgi:glycerophosphoryl diester phosphodiesterase
VIRYVGNAAPYPVAHRGGGGLAPENSFAAFSHAQYLETDLRITADGVCVAFHDRSLRRVLGRAGTIGRSPFAQLRALRFQGEVVPTLDELLERYPDACFMMDLKDPDALAPVIEILRRHRAVDRVCLAGATDRSLTAARDLAGSGLSTSLGWESVIRVACAARAGTSPRRLARSLPPAEFIHVPMFYGPLPVYCERLVELAHALDLRVMVWTIDDAPMITRLLDEGADGIITDRPDVLRETLIARNAWTTPRSVRPSRDAVTAAEPVPLSVTEADRVPGPGPT